MNRNPVWKYLALVLIVAFGVIYALPNLYVAEDGVQVVGVRNTEIDLEVADRITRALENEGIDYKNVVLDGSTVKARFSSEEDQSRAQEHLKQILGDNYGVALADLATTPGWLRGLGGQPMYLGLDLRGGVHFLLQVDLAAAETRLRESFRDELRRLFRTEKLRYTSIEVDTAGVIQARFRNAEDRDQAVGLIPTRFPELTTTTYQSGDRPSFRARLAEAAIAEVRDSAVQKNIIALRNRIDQLGVSEPVIQRQGRDRIVVQLPGVKDPVEARSIIGRTATLEVRMVDEENNLRSAVNGRVPVGSKRYFFRDGRPILLKQRLIISGENIIDARSGFNSQDGGPVVHITLDAKGAAIWSKVTGQNIKKRTAVIFVENVTSVRKDAEGNDRLVSKRIEEVITAPEIQDQLGKNFQITGLDSPKEAVQLALLLRAGSLAAPVFIVEERTVGPSLGKANISKGFQSVVYGFVAVLFFMVVYYRLFGAVASFALVLNLVIIVAVLSLLQATLTLPGVAGLVLTVGMAVDANVLIFERIREELRDGNAPQLSIHRGYDNAFSTIVDANVTTLIAALVLFNFGTGPIQGFAITLSIGIVTSMITAIFVTRILVNLFYGNRRLDTLPI